MRHWPMHSYRRQCSRPDIDHSGHMKASFLLEISIDISNRKLGPNVRLASRSTHLRAIRIKPAPRLGDAHQAGLPLAEGQALSARLYVPSLIIKRSPENDPPIDRHDLALKRQRSEEHTSELHSL